jgi:hypothetical protein
MTTMISTGKALRLKFSEEKKAAIFYELLFTICFNNYNTLVKNRIHRTTKIIPATSLIIFFDEVLFIVILPFSSVLNIDNHQ